MVTRTPSKEEQAAYRAALEVIAPGWWATGPHRPNEKMPQHIREAYKTVGRYVASFYGPYRPGNRPVDRLLAFRPRASLPPNTRLSTRIIRTKTKAGTTRSWTQVWLEVRCGNCVTRYRSTPRNTLISIRGHRRGPGNQVPNACGWRPMTANQVKHLPTLVRAFLASMAGKKKR